MTTQPLALQMAKDFDSYAGTLPDRFYFEAATELRLLHEVNQELLAVLQELIDIEGPQPGTATWADKARAAIAKAIGGAA